MVTLKDISKKSGYSVTTISKVLNNYSDIPPKTKKKILNICDEMGYIPNSSARSLRSQKSFTIGVIFGEVTGLGLQHPLFSKILESFKNAVEEEGYDIMFLSNKGSNARGSYLEHSIRKQVDATFVLTADHGSKEMMDLYKSEIPIVVIDYRSDDVCNITSNNRQGIFQAIEYLKQLGHTQIGTIHGGEFLEIGRLRKDIFREAMTHYGLEFNEKYNAFGNFFSKQDGYNAMKEILLRDAQPTAIFCASDMILFGAMEAINDVGKRVPEDFSLIGFDGIDIGQLLSPRMTTVKQDTDRMGEIAAEKILHMIHDKEHRQIRETIEVDTQFIIGETT